MIRELVAAMTALARRGRIAIGEVRGKSFPWTNRKGPRSRALSVCTSCRLAVAGTCHGAVAVIHNLLHCAGGVSASRRTVSRLNGAPMRVLLLLSALVVPSLVAAQGSPAQRSEERRVGKDV